MRTIKFRAWDGKRNVMLSERDIHHLPARYKSHTLMQLTGLKDKSGKEIYEGDIVKVYRKDSFALFNKGIIVYSDSYAEFLVQYTRPAHPNGILYQESIHANDGVTVFDRCSYWKLKVIGNLYENPELLKEDV